MTPTTDGPSGSEPTVEARRRPPTAAASRAARRWALLAVVSGGAALPWVGRDGSETCRPGGAAQATRAELSRVADAIERFRATQGTIPPELDALVSEVDDEGDGHLERVPRDAWGMPIRYARTPVTARGYVLESAGPDRRWGTDDDIVGSARSPNPAR
ncbi:MAG: type II secretion system protein GspG [Planctomycetes bacterium]|nr:type II secretion system protein GspG [Planctomycetota bacterium]